MSATAGMNFLEAKALAVRARRSQVATSAPQLAAARRQAMSRPAPPSFGAALRMGPSVGLIAEFKRRSPSAGALAGGEAAADAARIYVENGAHALSVLTDADDFGGTLDDLKGASAAFDVPVLRKDFIVDERQIVEARAAGAGAVLLIVGMLEDPELHVLVRAATDLEIETLVEVRSAAEADRAVAAGATTIGVNNRDLRTLSTDLATTDRIARVLPSGITVVSESGIRTASDVARARDAGAHAVLVGESLLRLAPLARADLVRELSEVPR